MSRKAKNRPKANVAAAPFGSVADLKKKPEKNVNMKNKKELKELDSLFKKSIKSERSEANEGISEHEPESELEEDVDDLNLNLQALEFHQFMNLNQQTEASAPVLERITRQAPRPIFVGGIPQGTTATGTEQSGGDEFKYMPGTADTNEPKYFAEPGIRTSPEPVDLTRTGTRLGFGQEFNQERFFMQSEQLSQSSNIERMERAGRIAETERRNPWERQETKYEKYKPKMPSGK